MKISSLSLFFALSTAPAMAQVAAPNLAPLRAPKLATVTSFISGLKEPQGMALNEKEDLFVCDYGAGEILRFSCDGNVLGKLAGDLKGPSQIVLRSQPIHFYGGINVFDPNFFLPFAYVIEGKANRVVAVDSAGKTKPLGQEIAGPVALVKATRKYVRQGLPIGLGVLSQTTSQIYRYFPLPDLSQVPLADGSPHLPQPKTTEAWTLFYSTQSKVDEQHKFSGLVNDGDVYYLSDVAGHQVLRVNEDGKSVVFASGISNPSGLVIGPDKMLYVANEGDGGQLIRLSNDGQKTVVAEKLGRPNSILFLDTKTALVSNRDGNIWKIGLP